MSNTVRQVKQEGLYIVIIHERAGSIRSKFQKIHLCSLTSKVLIILLSFAHVKNSKVGCLITLKFLMYLPDEPKNLKKYNFTLLGR